MIIVNNEEALRVNCSNLLLEEIGPIKDQLERELENSARFGQIGIGLAAPQIGIAKNMAIIRTPKYKVDLVNCKIIRRFDKAIFENEGCLSFPGRFERTWRFQEIVIGSNAVEPFNFIATGLFAVVCQHELDHLSGVLLPDLVIPKEITKSLKIGPNDLCPCNSNKKYKKCCRK